MMPLSSQALYFHLGMNADDDGFCEHFTVMRMTESKPDDLRVLNAKGFVKIFDDKVLVIIDWKENNYLRNDRYTPSKYLKIYKNELKGLVSGIPNDNQMDTQDRIGKDRIGEGIKSLTIVSDGKETNDLIFLFKAVNPSIQNIISHKSQRNAIDRMIKVYSRDFIEKVIKSLPQINAKPYWPKSVTPTQLEKNIPIYKAKQDEEKNNQRQTGIRI